MKTGKSDKNVSMSTFIAMLKGEYKDDITSEWLTPQTFPIPFNPKLFKSIQDRPMEHHPPPYKKLQQSVYLTSKPPLAEMPMHKCKCSAKLSESHPGTTSRTVIIHQQQEKNSKPVATPTNFDGCGETCINRMMFIECNDDSCSSPSSCTNRQFTSRKTKDMNVTFLPNKGFGLTAAEGITRGEFVIEYVGEVIDDAECEARLEVCKKNGEQHFYLMEVERNAVIDARLASNKSRFINHSCLPNCQTQKWNVNGFVRVGIFAIDNIGPGEEITMDYQFSHFGDEKAKCYCGAPTCAGVMNCAKKKASDNRTAALSASSTSLASVLANRSRPTPATSFALVKHGKLNPTSLQKSTLFVAHKNNDSDDYAAYVKSLKAQRSALRRQKKQCVKTMTGNWLQEALTRTQDAVVAHSCGGISNWNDVLSEYPLRKASTRKFRLSKHYMRRGLLLARDKRLRDIEAFAKGQCSWNQALDIRAYQLDANRVSRFVKAIDTEYADSIYTTTGSTSTAAAAVGDIMHDLNEDSCYRCSQPGELICCDGCPAALHLSCAGLVHMPINDDVWYCPECRSKKRRNDRAIRATTQLEKRCKPPVVANKENVVANLKRGKHALAQVPVSKRRRGNR